MAMRIKRSGAKRIAQCGRFRATLDATGCRHWVSICPVSPKRIRIKHTNFASNYGTFQSLVVCENFNPKTDPLLSSSMRQASFKCEMPRLELKSSRSFLAIKRWQGSKSQKVIKLAQSSFIKVAHICANRGIPVKFSNQVSRGGGASWGTR